MSEHISTPRPSVWDGEAGRRRRITYQVNNLCKGECFDLDDGRRVERATAYGYSVLLPNGIEKQYSGRLALLDALLNPPAPRKQKPLLPKQKSRYRGVWLNRRYGSWIARIGYETQEIRLGSFRTEEEAARAYDDFVIQHGLDRPLNFPHEAEGVAA